MICNSTTGQASRAWVIGSISLVFMFCFVLVIISWLCRNNNNAGQNSSMMSRLDKRQILQSQSPNGPINNGNKNTSKPAQLLQSMNANSQPAEMCLEGEKPRLAIYHNGELQVSNSQALLLSQGYSHASTQDLAIATLTGLTPQQPTTAEPFNYFIIDNTLLDTSQEAGQSIVLINPVHNGGNLNEIISPPPPPQGFQLHYDDHSARQSMNQSDGATSRDQMPACQADDILWNNQGSRTNSSSTTIALNTPTNPPVVLDQSSENNTPTGYFELHQFPGVNLNFNQHPTFCQFVSSPGAGHNLELNSLGELTVTDESSSFIHEQDPNGRQRMCPQCQLERTSKYLGLNSRQQQSPTCCQCIKMEQSDSSREKLRLQLVSSQYNSPSPGSSQSSGPKHSIMSNKRSQQKSRNEHVTFPDES